MAHHQGFGRGKGFTTKNPQPPNDLVMTPRKIAKATIDLYDIPNGSTILDPCRGEGSFYDNFPKDCQKEWCEIEEGRNFFDYENNAKRSLFTRPKEINDPISRSAWFG
jgi:hypothetical protein